MDDYHQRPKLSNFGIDPWKDLYTNLVFYEEVEHVFGKKGHNGWKVKVNKNLTTAIFCALLKLYKDVYAHPPLMVITQQSFCVVG
jgi:hypothetical protein